MPLLVCFVTVGHSKGEMTFLSFCSCSYCDSQPEKLILPLAGLGLCAFTNDAFLTISLPLNRELVTWHFDIGLFWWTPVIGLLPSGINCHIPKAR